MTTLHQPISDGERHRPFEELERGVRAMTPPTDNGKLALIVVRGEHGRELPERTMLTLEQGVPGDSWGRKNPHKIDSQITVMRADVARLFANGQALSVFGDNLLVDLDLSLSNLPPGSRLQLGKALLEVTPLPHTGCAKFRQRVGDDAHRLTADERMRHLRLRGIHVRVIEAGEVAVGDSMQVLKRA